ncbi:unnamed protein product, partial [Larinioides sclopetarius]
EESRLRHVVCCSISSKFHSVKIPPRAICYPCNTEALQLSEVLFVLQASNDLIPICFIVYFLPECRDPGGIFSQPQFANFRTLIDRANDWLRTNRRWKVITCESVEFKAKGDNVSYDKMVYLEYGEHTTTYVRGLRLWVGEKETDFDIAQQIGYLNLVPNEIGGGGGIFSSPDYECLDDVVSKYNREVRTRPLPGRIITIESQEIKLKHSLEVDPDRSHWVERGSGPKRFIFVLRIFFEISDGVPEEIEEGAVNPQKMNYLEHGNRLTCYVRILRLAYTKIRDSSNKSLYPDMNISRLTCRTFVPVQLTNSIFVPEFESLHATKERVTAWVKATGAKVISAETAALRMYTGGEERHGTEATFTYNRAERSEYWIFVIRIYINGAPQEPPKEMLPPVPEIEDQGCCIMS